MNGDELSKGIIVAHLGIANLSLEQAKIEGHTVIIRAGTARFACPLTGGPWLFEVPLGTRWARFCILDQADEVQGEGKISMRIPPAKQDIWMKKAIPLINAQKESLGKLSFKFLVCHEHLPEDDNMEEPVKPQPKMTPYKVEASDFEKKSMPAAALRQKESFLGLAVPEFPGADQLSIEELQRQGFTDLRNYHVVSFLANLM